MLCLSIFWGLSLDYCIPSASLVLPLGWMLITLKENTFTTQNCIELLLPVQTCPNKTHTQICISWCLAILGYTRGVVLRVVSVCFINSADSDLS